MARTIRIFHAEPITVGDEITLSTIASRHLIQVLRLNLNSEFNIFTGDGHEFLVRYVAGNKNALLAKVISSVPTIAESPLQIHLGQAISRGDKMDYAIQKAVELGATEITPLFTDTSQIKSNSPRLEKKMHHWQGIIIHATQQSGRAFLPKLNPAMDFAAWICAREETTFICATTKVEKSLIEKDLNKVAICIGAEGGFNVAEMEFAAQNNIHAIKLGSRILRTETAVPVALTILQSHWGDMQGCL